MLNRIRIPILAFMVWGSACAGAGEFSILPDANSGVRGAASLGSTVEQFPPPDAEFKAWAKKPDGSDTRGDKIEVRQVQDEDAKTVKLQNVVPPIHFDSGKANIPESYIGLLRDVLDKMKDRVNVRLHFIGHTDNVKLVRDALRKYGDNTGLSRERAGTVAEYFQRSLGLPPESISYEGMGETMPIAGNDTAAGRAKNRRVEVEVWYDEITEKMVEREVLVEQHIKRVKVCRVETVCKLSYKEGEERRARIKNLVAPLHYDEQNTDIPRSFLRQLKQALQNLESKQNVIVKFIGHTDDIPLVGRDARIYGNHLGLSRARARRVALAVQDALGLPSSVLTSDGKGASYPLASNDTEKGRRINRRIEVEFWYDDPLQELPDEPQICPESSSAETVTRVYDPPSGAIVPVWFDANKPAVPAGYSQRLGRLMKELNDKANVRLRFIGYVNNERLNRRTAAVYGDDIGLSTARARRVMEIVKNELGLTEDQAEYEGHGYVQTDDVVNAGFIESDRSRVVAQIVYDELAVLDDREGMDVKRLTREVEVQSPWSLNLMRITVDGKPIDDPRKSVPDVQRCTDVALNDADIQFKFDNMDFKPRLNVTAWPTTIRYQDDVNTRELESLVRFRLYSNYLSYVERAEVRLFEADQSLRDDPIAVIPVNPDGEAHWQADFDEYRAPGKELKYVARVYDAAGQFDETREQRLWVVDRVNSTRLSSAKPDQELLTGYGENRLGVQNIPLAGGAIKVYGKAIPENHSVWLAGRRVPLGKDREFVAEELLPSGSHMVEVALLDEQGSGELFMRDLELERNDWFYVGLADITLSKDSTNGPAQLVTNDVAHYDNDLNAQGRIAFYGSGKFGDGWQLSASADTREEAVKDIFSNLMNKAPDAIFRRIDPDYYYPTYGDDSSVEEGAPTLGKFYVKLKKHENYGLWGNFNAGYTDNTLAHVDRSLYGANLHLESPAITSFGEHRFKVDAFSAEPGTVAGRDEFRGTGGSLYYMRHQDILNGSERVRVEIRDKDSGMVVGVKNLAPALDYDIDYIQGRLLLSESLSATTSDGMLVDSGSNHGDLAYLVVRYEYTPGFDDIHTLALGGRAHYWVGDHFKMGLTSNRNEEDGAESSLDATDVTIRKNANTWTRIEVSRSQGKTLDTLVSGDGGYSFDGTGDLSLNDGKAAARRVDGSIALSDFTPLPGKVTFYHQAVDAGYAAPGLNTLKDISQFGSSLTMSAGERVDIRAKLDKKEEQEGLQTSAYEVDLDYNLNDNWTVNGGLRADDRRDLSEVVPLTQRQGRRSDLRIQATYDSKSNWTTYAFVQDTLSATGNREDNGQIGSGGSYRLTDRFRLNGELAQGDIGTNAHLGTEFLYSDRTSLELNYALENERTDNGLRARKGNLTSGFRTRYSDSASVYLEERYTHGDVPTGLTHSTGVDIAPNDRWNYGAHLDAGNLRDQQTGAETQRKAMGLTLGYSFKTITLASSLEYRADDRENPDMSIQERRTWLIKNSLKYQVTPDWRIIGKYNHSQSSSSQGEFYDGDFTEAVLGYAYRPVDSDRLNAIVKYTYFYNLPTADQVTLKNTAAEYIQKSHIISMDVDWDVTASWSLGAKYAYRLGQLSQDRSNPEFFDSNAQLYIVRADWHVVHDWDLLMEGRMLDLTNAEDRRSGALVGLYRHLGEKMKVGIGYNFTSFSDDLTDFDYDSQGYFLNVIGKF